MIEYEFNIGELPKVDKQEYEISAEFGKDIPKSMKELGYNKDFFEIKKKFFETDKNLFYKYKSILNTYSLVNFNYNTSKSFESLTGILPTNLIGYDKAISRAYYKLFEILNNMDIIPKKKSIISGNIAEAPGGFIQALIDYRKENTSNHYYTISLKMEGESSRSFDFKQKRVANFMKKYRNDDKMITVSYGNKNSGNGNINKLENIKGYAKLFADNKADIVTADGGFESDESVWENPEMTVEVRTLQLLYNEVVAALSIQGEGGSFVLKIFGCSTKILLEILYLLSIHYDNVYIVKPVTSNILSHERYIVAKGFRGISNEELEGLYTITEKWLEIDPSGGIKLPSQFIEQLFVFKPEIGKDYINAVKKCNDWWYDINDKLVKQIAVFIESNKKGNINKEFFRKLLEKQQEIALKWFKQYDIPVIKEAIIDFNKVKISNVVINNKVEKPKKEKKEAKKENKVEEEVKEEKPKKVKEVKEKKVVKKTVKKTVVKNNKSNNKSNNK